MTERHEIMNEARKRLQSALESTPDSLFERLVVAQLPYAKDVYSLWQLEAYRPWSELGDRLEQTFKTEGGNVFGIDPDRSERILVNLYNEGAIIAGEDNGGLVFARPDKIERILGNPTLQSAFFPEGNLMSCVESLGSKLSWVYTTQHLFEDEERQRLDKIIQRRIDTFQQEIEELTTGHLEYEGAQLIAGNVRFSRPAVEPPRHTRYETTRPKQPSLVEAAQATDTEFGYRAMHLAVLGQYAFSIQNPFHDITKQMDSIEALEEVRRRTIERIAHVSTLADVERDTYRQAPLFVPEDER